LILSICRDVEKVCPDAWVINYVNPSSVMGIGVMRHANVRSFALCDGHHLPWKKLGYLKMLGESEVRESAFSMRIAGVNHFTWMLKAELDGVDVLPRLRDGFASQAAGEKDAGHSKGRYNNFITAQLYDLFGALPTCTGHTKEYLSFYQGHAAIQEAIPPLSIFDSDERDEITEAMWTNVRELVEETIPISEFQAKTKSDHATDIIHTMVVEDGRNYYINLPNCNAVDGGKPVGNLPDDAFLELECRLDRNGPQPLAAGDFPMGLRALQMQILDVHELTVEAIVRRDKALLARALAIDPLVNSIATANAVIDALFEQQAETLGEWNDSRRSVALGAKADKQAAATPQLY